MDRNLPTGCADPAHFVRARMLKGNRFEAVCEAVPEEEIRAELIAVWQKAKAALSEMSAAMLMVGRYTAVNESRIRALSKDVEARAALDRLLWVCKRVHGELRPALRAINGMTKKSVGRVNKVAVLSGLTAHDKVIESMQALFFDALGAFAHHMQIEVAGFDVESYGEVADDAWFRSLRVFGQGVVKRLHGFYANLRQMSILSAEGLLAMAAMAAMKRWLLPTVLGEGAVDPRFEIAEGSWREAAWAVCKVVNNVDFYRRYLPPALRAVARTYGKWVGGEPAAMAEQFKAFAALADANRPAARAIAHIDNLGAIVKQIKAQYDRIDAGEEPAADDPLPALTALLGFVNGYVFDATWFAYGVKPLCTALSFTHQAPSAVEQAAYSGNLFDSMPAWDELQGAYGEFMDMGGAKGGRLATNLFGEDAKEAGEAVGSLLSAGLLNTGLGLGAMIGAVAAPVGAGAAGIGAGLTVMGGILSVMVPKTGLRAAKIVDTLQGDDSNAAIGADIFAAIVSDGEAVDDLAARVDGGAVDAVLAFRLGAAQTTANVMTLLQQRGSGDDAEHQAAAIELGMALRKQFEAANEAEQQEAAWNVAMASEKAAAFLGNSHEKTAVTLLVATNSATAQKAANEAIAAAAEGRAFGTEGVRKTFEEPVKVTTQKMRHEQKETYNKANKHHTKMLAAEKAEHERVVRGLMWFAVGVFAAYVALTEGSTNTDTMLSNDLRARVTEVDPKLVKFAEQAWAKNKRLSPRKQ